MQQEHDQPEEKRRRGLRVFFLIGVTALATAAVGFGGLAAWSVTTQNNGSTFSAGTVHHTNAATANVTVTGATGSSTNATCNDTTSPGACGVIFNVNAAKPGASVTGTVQITNTGSLQSTFTLALTGAPASTPVGNTICNDLTLLVKDNESTPATVYTGSLAGFSTPTAIKTAAGAANWNTGDTGTYTYTIALAASPLATSMGGTCTAGMTFTQTNT